jgi:hypothetical protein
MFSFSLLCALQLFVPIDDPVYDFLERQATRGYIPEFLNDTKPLQRNEIVKWLIKIDNIKDKLNKIDKNILSEIMVDYRPELSELKNPYLPEDKDFNFGLSGGKHFKKEMKSIFSLTPDHEEKHLYTLENDVNTVWFDLDLSTTADAKNIILRSINQVGAQVSMQTGKHLSMYVDGYMYFHTLTDEWHDISPEYAGYWVNDEYVKNIAYFDRSEAYMNYTGDLGTITIAHHPLNWGNGLNSIILSDRAVNFGSLRWSKQFKHFKYSVLHASLMTPRYETITENGRYYIPKYLAAHRIEILFSPKFHFNLSELVTYGGEDRIPELTYLVPTILLWPSEHTLGDRGNKMITFESELFPVNGLRLFGSFFMDELVIGEIFSDFWANKFAVQGGFQISPRSLPADLIFEATAVHPWIYTHRFVFGSYTHHGRDLGFFAGPNTQYYTAKLNYDISSRHRISLTGACLLEGADSILVGGITYPNGGDSNQDDYSRSRTLDDATTWLMGDVERTLNLKLEWLYRWRKAITFLSTCEFRNEQGVNDIYYSFKINFNY